MWEIVIEKVNRKRKYLLRKKWSNSTWRWAKYFWYCLWNGPWTRTIQRISKNSTISVSFTHHWNLIPSNIAKIREKLHSFMFSFKFHSFMFSFKFHSFIFSFKFHSTFILSFIWELSLVAWLRVWTCFLDPPPAARWALCVCVCVCVRAKITRDCVPESEDKSRFASMQSHEFRLDPNPGIVKISRTFKVVFFPLHFIWLSQESHSSAEVNGTVFQFFFPLVILALRSSHNSADIYSATAAASTRARLLFCLDTSCVCFCLVQSWRTSLCTYQTYVFRLHFTWIWLFAGIKPRWNFRKCLVLRLIESLLLFPSFFFPVVFLW
jgi:hypothetical protein